MMMNQKILICEDDQSSQALIQSWMGPFSNNIQTVQSRDQARTLIQTERFDKVILDAWLEDGLSLPLLQTISSEDPWADVVVISADKGVANAVTNFGFRNQSFMLKPLTREGLMRGLGLDRLPRENGLSPRMIECIRDLGIVSKSKTMFDIFRMIDRLKDSRCNILLQGDSGTGKEMLAKLTHVASNRASQPFDAISCAAIPETLLESMLFGVKKGAFTDAREDRKGLFEACSGGTLFLDEVGEMPIGMQAKLLRVIQEQEVRPLGSNKSIKIDTRVITATNRDLQQACNEGTFRQDLFYRIAVVGLVLPALKDRKEDIAPLAEAFLKEFSATYGSNLVIPNLSQLEELVARPWPGNVRQLRNAVERLVLLGEDLSQLPSMTSLADSPEALRAQPIAPDAIADLEKLPSFDDFFAVQEHRYLQRALELSRGNVTVAARMAGKHRVAFHRSLKRSNINPSDFRTRSTDLVRSN